MDSFSYLIGIVIAAVAATFVSQDARKRGMSPVGWFLGTFLLCIVFLPLYLIIRKPLLGQNGGSSPGPGGPNPPQYGGTYPAPGTYPSPQQGQFPPASGGPYPSSDGTTKFCPTCGQNLAANAAFCPSCGAAQPPLA